MHWEGAWAGGRVSCGGLEPGRREAWVAGPKGHRRMVGAQLSAAFGSCARDTRTPARWDSAQSAGDPRLSCSAVLLWYQAPGVGQAGCRATVSHTGVPTSGATTQPSRSQSSRFGPVRPGLRWCLCTCRPPHSGSTALPVRTQAPEHGDSTDTGQPSPSPGTWQLAGAEPFEASPGDPPWCPIGLAGTASLVSGDPAVAPTPALPVR